MSKIGVGVLLVTCVLTQGCTELARAAGDGRTTMAGNDCRSIITVAAGGVAGFASLADPANTAELRRFCGTRLYIHDFIWTRTSVDVRRRILEIFKQPAEVEFGLVAGAAAWFATVYLQEYQALGVRAEHGHVNVLAEHLQSDWKPFVDAARQYGFVSVAPILAPNQGEYRSAPFRDSRWDRYREAARYGGGLTVDAPVDLFLSQPPAYRSFVEDEVRWAHANGLRSAFILSPGASASLFEREAIEVADALRRADALPSEFIVETYEGGSASGYPNAIGSDAVPDTITGTARLLALHLAELP